jgi:hypothetical protein
MIAALDDDVQIIKTAEIMRIVMGNPAGILFQKVALENGFIRSCCLFPLFKIIFDLDNGSDNKANCFNTSLSCD